VEQRPDGLSGRCPTRGECKTTRRTALEPLLSPKQATDLASLLTAVSQQARLGPEYRGQADYWASQVKPGLDADGAQTIAALLQDVAGSPWLPAHMEQWARAWTASLEEFTG
jgi:hypothetical protein